MKNLSIESLYEEYQAGASLYEIAKKYGKHANTIRRQFKRAGFTLRNQSEAQKLSLQRGTRKHPTQGTTRSPETCKKIGEAVSESCDRELRSKIAKENWDKQSDAFKRGLIEKAHAGMRRAAEEGSKLELEIMARLAAARYKAKWHCAIPNSKMHVDILLESKKIAIEIDGPTHHVDMWGEEKLAKVQAADAVKNENLLNRGYTVIRVKSLRKSTSKTYAEQVFQALLPILKNPDKQLHFVEVPNG